MQEGDLGNKSKIRWWKLEVQKDEAHNPQRLRADRAYSQKRAWTRKSPPLGFSNWLRGELELLSRLCHFSPPLNSTRLPAQSRRTPPDTGCCRVPNFTPAVGTSLTQRFNEARESPPTAPHRITGPDFMLPRQIRNAPSIDSLLPNYLNWPLPLHTNTRTSSTSITILSSPDFKAK